MAVSGQAVVLHLHVGALRAEGVGVAARDRHGGLASAREQELQQGSLTAAGEQDQAVWFGGQVAPGDDRGLGVGEIGVGEQTAEAGVAGRILGQRDEVGNASEARWVGWAR